MASNSISQKTDMASDVTSQEERRGEERRRHPPLLLSHPSEETQHLMLCYQETHEVLCCLTEKR